ncbi:MAG: protoporphyrinogen oxidase [Chloroflexi bacterium]|nr:protoporphyrinogen oxidase [Chloroflexota bacterium]
MSDEVLVAYATRHETTRAIAAAIAEVLAATGVRVRLEAIDAIGDLRAFRAAVIGCTVYDGAWMPGAHAFLSAHERQLEGIPVWLFASGPAEPLPDGATVDVSPELVSVIERIGPRDVALFAGSLQPHHLGAGLRILARLARSSLSEHRDWAAVERWAARIAEELGTAAEVKKA